MRFTSRHWPGKLPYLLQLTEKGMHCNSSEKKKPMVHTQLRPIIVQTAIVKILPWNILQIHKRIIKHHAGEPKPFIEKKHAQFGEAKGQDLR